MYVNHDKICSDFLFFFQIKSISYLFKAQIKLVNHYLKTENLETCTQLCNHIIKTVSDPGIEVLEVIIQLKQKFDLEFYKYFRIFKALANLSFKKGEIDEAITKFKRLFEKRKDHYPALATLTRFLYRAGKIEEMKYFFENIEKELPKAVTEPGYNYAMGLFYQ